MILFIAFGIEAILAIIGFRLDLSGSLQRNCASMNICFFLTSCWTSITNNLSSFGSNMTNIGMNTTGNGIDNNNASNNNSGTSNSNNDSATHDGIDRDLE